MKDRLRRAALRATGGNVSHRLCLAALCLLIARNHSAHHGSDLPRRDRGDPGPGCEASHHRRRLQFRRRPAGYAGTDTCLTCHDRPGESSRKARSTRRRRTRARRRRATAARAATVPGQAHVDDDAKGHILKFKELTAGGVSQTCLTCHNRGSHAGWEGSAHERARTCRAPPATACTARSRPRRSWSRRRRPSSAPRATAPRSPRPSARSRTCRCARARCPARRATTRTARSATSRR